MKKTGYLIFFLSLGLLIPCITAFTLLLSSYLGIQARTVRADEFLSSEPVHRYVNTSLAELLDEGTTLKNVRDDSVCARYVSAEGIEFVSKSEEWDEKDLELLYAELLCNKHGEEIYHLTNVTVYPQRDDYAAATHQNSSQLCSVPFSHTLLPEGFEVEYFRTGGIITLYNGDGITTVAGMADSLSHEYGHHFTRYYMLNGEGEEL